MVSVLKFNDFQRINEQENPVNKSELILSAESILDTFFGIYGEIVPKIGEYQDAIEDLKDLEEEETLEGKGKKMQEIIVKVSKLLKKPYSSMSGELTSFGKQLEATWKTLVSDESAEKEAKKIRKAVKEKLFSYIKNLIEASKEKKKLMDAQEEEEVSEGLNTIEIGGSLLLERVVKEEREQLLSTLVTIKTQLETEIKTLKGTSATSEYVGKCRESLKKVVGFENDLAAGKFEGLKRLEKKEKIDEIIEGLKTIRKELEDAKSKTLVKFAVNERIKKAIQLLNTKKSSITAALAKIDLEMQDSPDEEEDSNSEQEEENSSDFSVDTKDFSDLKVGGDNSKKAGKNQDKIKSFQTLYNVINPKKKIAEDGLFGTKSGKRGQTEDAILYVANLLSTYMQKPEIVEATKNGTVLTAEVQALTKLFVEKVLPEMKKKFAEATESKNKEVKKSQDPKK